MILFDAFATKSLHIFLPVSLRLTLCLKIGKTLQEKSFTGRLYFPSVISQFDFGWFSQMWIFIELYQPCNRNHTSVALCIAHCSSLFICLFVYIFEVSEVWNCSFLLLQPPLPPVCGPLTGLSICLHGADRNRTDKLLYYTGVINFPENL